MKRIIVLIFLVAIGIFAIHFLETAAPFMPVAGNSMEPELVKGDLIIIEPRSPSQVKEGDIIVFNVPTLIQQHYNYPPVVAHRVIKVITEGGVVFRTKGDNTSEDPFTVLASDLRGQVSQRIPYLGYGIFFLQSTQGLIFMIIALSLLVLYFYRREFSQTGRNLRHSVFAPILEENRQLAQRQEQALDMSSKALAQFAAAMSEYAHHLASHTDAVKSMAKTSQELHDAVREMNSMMRSWQAIVEGRQSKPGVECQTEERAEPIIRNSVDERTVRKG